MITGIDETGDFAINSTELNFFVGVHIDQNLNRYEIKRSQFNIWESTIPEVNKNKGEVKGKGLTEEQLSSFFHQVIATTPVCKYSVVQIKPSENPEVILKKHQAIEVRELERVVSDANGKGFIKMAKSYDDIRIWTRGLNYQKMIKLKCLEQILGLSFHNSFLNSQLRYLADEDESNLSNIQFKIDKDFVRAENTRIMWGEMFRQFWRDYTRENRLTVLQEARDIVHKHFEFTNDGRIVSNDVFVKQTNFFESNDNWEVRLADILGYIIHRYKNKGRCKETGELIFKGLRTTNFSHLILNDVKE